MTCSEKNLTVSDISVRVFKTHFRSKGAGGRSGNSALEFALFAPWYIFLFLGTFDFGFYSYSLIAVQNAARIGAFYASSSSLASADTTTVCRYALGQLKSLPNVGSSMALCTSPVTVTSGTITGPDGSTATRVTVTYRTPDLFAIPNLFPGTINISRTVVMRTRS